MTSLASTETPRAGLDAYIRARAWSLIVWTAMAVWTGVLFLATRAAYEDFRYGRFDLGNMVQAVWSTAHGRPLDTTMGATGEQLPRIAGHVDPILILLTPAWIVAPSPLTLAAIQIAACALGALPIYWLARKHLESEATASVLAVAYLAYPWLAWIAIEAMHPITLAIPLILFAVWFLDSDRLLPFAVFAGLALMCGELVGATLALLGVWYAVRGHPRPGLVIAAAGTAWTALCLYVIIPAFSGGTSMFYDLYAEVGSSPQGVLRTLVHDPDTVVSALLGAGDVQYLALIVMPTAGLCLLSPGLLLVATPQLVANGLSSQWSATDPRLHLVSMVVPFVVAATVLGIRRLPLRAQSVCAVTVLALCAGISFAVGPWLGSKHNRWHGGKPSAAHLAAVREAIALVPNDAAVSTTNRAGAYLSDRRVIYSAPIVSDSSWVLLDFDDPWVPVRGRVTWGALDGAPLRSLARKLSRSPSWQRVFSVDRVLVFERTVSRKTETG